jgi:protein-S-isoprenylcysteine O-methyltransferase Ste14
LAAAAFAADAAGPLPIHGQPAVGWAALGISLIPTLAVAGWALRSLPPADRGKTLITSGAFRYFRHPLYASFLTFFDFGLALYLDHWVFLIWALAQHPIWHWNMLHEEQLMRREFGDEYDAYCARTGRFVPRIWRRYSPG